MNGANRARGVSGLNPGASTCQVEIGESPNGRNRCRECGVALANARARRKHERRRHEGWSR